MGAIPEFMRRRELSFMGIRGKLLRRRWSLLSKNARYFSRSVFKPCHSIIFSIPFLIAIDYRHNDPIIQNIVYIQTPFLSTVFRRFLPLKSAPGEWEKISKKYHNTIAFFAILWYNNKMTLCVLMKYLKRRNPLCRSFGLLSL